MLDDVFVIDGVAHGSDLDPANDASELGRAFAEYSIRIHQRYAPRNQPQWIPAPERFSRGTNPYELAHVLFAESQTDACIYHGLPLFPYFKNGGSPLWIGKEMQKRWPGRVALYGPISPWQPDALEEVDRLIEEEGVIGLKLYPFDIVQGSFKGLRMDDPEVAFPIFERAQAKGLRVIAVHKAIPIGPVPSAPFRPQDVEGAAAAFPQLTFEVVHGGHAFLEETLMLMHFPNVAINLEATSAYLPNSPRTFAEIIGAMLYWGGANRVIWATGADAIHPRPPLEAFWNLEMPRDLVEERGFPELTREIKRAILCENIARIHHFDINAMKQEIANDEFANRGAPAAPWSALVKQ